MENEKKVQSTKVEVQKENEKTESKYPGIYIQKDNTFKRRSELTKEEIKQFPKVLAELQAKFTIKENSRRDSIQVRVYPFLDKTNKEIQYYSGIKSKTFYSFIKINDDNQVRLVRGEYANVLLSLGIEPELKDAVYEIPRYARFTTGLNPITNERYYRLQLFLSFDYVKSIFFDYITLETMSKLIKSGKIEPVVFIEPASDDIEFKKEEKEIELI